MALLNVFKNGLWKEHPIFKLFLGLCPVLAVTTSAENGLAMGLATMFVLLSSEVVISLFRDFIPNRVRIPSFIVIIATFVTIVDYVLKAFFPAIAQELSIFIPLIVCNCLILGRNEAFASRNTPGRAVIDSLGMGVGFTWGLVLLSMIRELFGAGTIFGVQILGEWFTTWQVMILPPGAFLTLGVLLAIFNQIAISFEKRDRRCQ